MKTLVAEFARNEDLTSKLDLKRFLLAREIRSLIDRLVPFSRAFHVTIAKLAGLVASKRAFEIRFEGVELLSVVEEANCTSSIFGEPWPKRKQQDESGPA